MPDLAFARISFWNAPLNIRVQQYSICCATSRILCIHPANASVRTLLKRKLSVAGITRYHTK